MDSEQWFEEALDHMYPVPSEEEQIEEVLKDKTTIEDCIIQICKEHYAPDFKSIAYEIKEYFNL